MVGRYVRIHYELFIGLKHTRIMCLYLTTCDPSSWLEEHVKWGVIFHEIDMNLESGDLVEVIKPD